MKRKRYTPEQIVYALKQAEAGEKVPELCRVLGVSDPRALRLPSADGAAAPRRFHRGSFFLIPKPLSVKSGQPHPVICHRLLSS